ncbi:MAG TPA: cytochrome b/b6 domain-containing protein [Pseudomonadales bacterium]
MTGSTKYGATAKWLHWTVAVIVIVMLIGGRTLESLPISEREQIIMVHSGLGTLVLLLMLVRVWWRTTHAVPGPVSTMGAVQVRLSHTMHRALYVLIILQTLLGIGQAMFLTEYRVMAFGLLDYTALTAGDETLAGLFHAAHGINSILLSVLVLGHIGAALYHHFAKKDDVLRRMWPGGRVSGG